MKTGPFVRAPGRVTGFTVDSSLLVIRARNFERRGALYWLIKNECRGEREEQRDIYSRVAMREDRSNFIEGYRAFTTWSRHLFPLRLLNGELWRSRQNFAHTTDVTANNSEMHRVCVTVKLVLLSIDGREIEILKATTMRRRSPIHRRVHIARPHAQRVDRVLGTSVPVRRSKGEMWLHARDICRCHVKCVRL